LIGAVKVASCPNASILIASDNKIFLSVAQDMESKARLE
jgi:hypothetical protein